MATFNFKKAPKAKNLVNRSLSFPNRETQLISPNDTVNIEVFVGSGTTINVPALSGKKFLASLKDVGHSEYKVFKF